MPVSSMPPNSAMVVGLRWNCHSPTAPTATNGRLETTFQKFGTPRKARASAKLW